MIQKGQSRTELSEDRERAGDRLQQVQLGGKRSEQHNETGAKHGRDQIRRDRALNQGKIYCGNGNMH
ncbi:hypothetical protein NDU88_004195 [Pleurodeles waltl]|uniref:Uncharacterized protein n=1 Tax=Pleurodeles waltl TaxID=8319 RepID=A0AAV7QDU5_PLEWA|nr:hypothetical protein NDU88_004195 [Pleurodeles waltl]